MDITKKSTQDFWWETDWRGSVHIKWLIRNGQTIPKHSISKKIHEFNFGKITN